MTSDATPDPVGRFRAIVARRLGLQFDDRRVPELAEVLRRRTIATEIDPETYLSRLDTNGGLLRELPGLSQDLTVTETYFFRNRAQLEAFRHIVLPARRAARNANRTFRFLSAGCASGEEPYTIAILIREAWPEVGSMDVSLLGIDANRAMLKRAEAALYSEWSLRETPPNVLARYFRKEGRAFALDSTVTKMVTFEEQNLADPALHVGTPESLDVVFFRNVVMYFTPEAAQSIVTKLARALAPGGFLFLGEAETLRGLSSEFHLRHTHDTFYYERKGAENAFSESRTDGGLAPVDPGSSSAVDAGSWFQNIENATRRIEALTDAAAVRSPDVESPPVLDASRDAPLSVASALELFRNERFTEAHDLLDRLPPAWTESDPDALLLKAVILAQRGDTDLAGGACRNLLAVDETNAGAHYVLALCHESAADAAGAREHYRMAVYLDGAFAMPRLHLGLLARKSGDRDAAERELKIAEKLLQREDAPRILLFGGGFSRGALLALCRAELESCRGSP